MAGLVSAQPCPALDAECIAMGAQNYLVKGCMGSAISARKQAVQQMAEPLDELRRRHELTLGRESRVIELKREVNQLLAKAGQPPRYAELGGKTDES